MTVVMNWKQIGVLIGLLIAAGVATFVDTGPMNKNDPPKSFKGFGPGDQSWNFVNVREGAHMFWWLYFTTATDIQSPTERPLAIWLQGGPGASSTGYGNFEEFGPLDLDLNERNFTWVKDMNVLFIDSPVGAGFSYVEDEKYLTTDNRQISNDLVELLRGFYRSHPEFRTVPLHIFSESYGGKVAVEFAYVLNKEIEAETIECNLKSVASVDGWISPIDSMLSWAPFLLNMGFVDHDGHDEIMESTLITKKELDEGRFENSTHLWGITEDVIDDATNGINFYNVLTPTRQWRNQDDVNNKNLIKRRSYQDIKKSMYNTLVRYAQDTRQGYVDPLDELMLGPVSEALNIPEHVVFGSQSSITFDTLAGDFMKPVTDYVELLLNETSIEVSIITGQLDLIVATPGTVEWVRRLQWSEGEQYASVARRPILINQYIEGYYKRQKNLTLYWINRAGHMVPYDNPKAMDYILKYVTKYDQ